MERLQKYYPFDDAVLAAVSEAAGVQNTETFEDLAARYGIEDGPQKVAVDGSKQSLEVLTFTPKGDYDETRARVYHLTMGNIISKALRMHPMRLFEADPSEQLIVVGNPSGPGHAAGKVGLQGLKESVQERSLRPFAEPLLRYLDDQNIETVTHLGYSYGADKAAVSARYGADYDQEAPAAVLVEPASVAPRSMLALAKAFASTGKEQQRYIDQTESASYLEVRSQESPLGLAVYGSGLMRLSNLAVSKVLAGGGFEDRVQAALDAQPDMNVAIGWGTASELTPNDEIEQAVADLQSRNGLDRVQPMRFDGMHHAGGDDIDLYAAMYLQGLQLTAQN